MSKQRQKYLQKLTNAQRKKLIPIIKQLSLGDFTGLDVKPLVGEKHIWRCRVGGLRIKFFYDGNTVTIITLLPRGDVY